MQQSAILKFICSDQLSKSWLLTWENSLWLSHCNKGFFHPQPLFTLMLFHSFCFQSLPGSFIWPTAHNAFRFVTGNWCLSYNCWCNIYILPMVQEELCKKVVTDILIMWCKHLNIVLRYYFITAASRWFIIYKRVYFWLSE